MALDPAEELTIRAFVVAERRPRYLEQLGAPERRAPFLDQRLNHCRDLDERFATPASNVTADDLLRLGAPETCRVISSARELDGREMPLSEALDEVRFHGWGTIICCIPGRLAYYRGETGEREFILVRSAPR